MLNIRSCQEADYESIILLWEHCGLTRPWNDPETDIFRKVAQQDGLFLVALKDQHLIGTVMGGYDGHRGWASYLAVAPEQQQLGVATALMQQLEKRLIALGCPKLQLLVRTDNTDVINFYDKLGYASQDVVCLGKRLIEDI